MLTSREWRTYKELARTQHCSIKTASFVLPSCCCCDSADAVSVVKRIKSILRPVWRKYIPDRSDMLAAFLILESVSQTCILRLRYVSEVSPAFSETAEGGGSVGGWGGGEGLASEYEAPSYLSPLPQLLSPPLSTILSFS